MHLTARELLAAFPWKRATQSIHTAARRFQLEDVQDGAWADWTSLRTSAVFELCSKQEVAAPRKVRQALSIAWVPALPRSTPTYARLLKAAQPAAVMGWRCDPLSSGRG